MELGIPMAVQVVIDDVGWWCGSNGSARGEPFRTGFTRDHVLADYAAIIELGRRLNIRPQAALILCEWDRTNLLRELPSATWMGAQWDNARWQGPWLDEAADLLRREAAHIELALHGVGHEFWSGASFTRAEWHDMDGRMRPADEVRRHLDCYARLMEQNGLGAFPTAYVPAAFLHRFGGPFAAILAEYGVRYASTPFARMHRNREPDDPCFGVESGLLTLDRGQDRVHWQAPEGAPATGPDGAICGMHWPNLLHRDPARHDEVVARWVNVLEPLEARFDRMLAPDTAAGFSQLAYHRRTRVIREGADCAVLDFDGVDALGAAGLRDSLFVKVRADGSPRFEAEGLQIEEIRREPGQVRLRLKRIAGAARGALRVRGKEGT